MANKLSDIFSDKPLKKAFKISFEDSKARLQFVETLKDPKNSGKTIDVKGIKKLKTELKSGNKTIPLDDVDHIMDTKVFIHEHYLPIEFDTAKGKSIINFSCKAQGEDMICETSEPSIVYMKMTFHSDKDYYSFDYRARPNLAVNLEELRGAYEDALAFLEYMFRPDNDEAQVSGSESLDIAKTYFRDSIKLYEKMLALEKELMMEFRPISHFTDEEYEDVEELYALLINSKVLRYNAKITSNVAKGVSVLVGNREMVIGKELDMTFINQNTYTVWGNNINLYTANLLTNAIVEDIIDNGDGSTKILYKENESKPMFISYRGFTNLKQAEEELEQIMDHVEQYREAQTLDQYLNERSCLL